MGRNIVLGVVCVFLYSHLDMESDAERRIAPMCMMDYMAELGRKG